MGKIHSVIKGQSSDFIQDKMRDNAMFEVEKCDKDTKTYLKIMQKICYYNKGEQHPMQYLLKATRQVYILTQHSNDSTVDYFNRFKSAQKVLEYCGGILTQEVVLNYGCKLLLSDTSGQYNRFSEINKFLAAKSGEEMMTATLYLENYNDGMYSKLKQKVEHEYLLRKYEYPNNVFELQIPL